jgi:hypothetical protein
MGGHASETLQMHTDFWFKNLKVRNHLEDKGTDGRIKQKHLKEEG